MSQTEKTFTLVTSKFTKRSWLENARGKRVTHKFKLQDEYRKGEFVELETDKYVIIYHERVPELICFAPKSTASLYQLIPQLYRIYWEDVGDFLYNSNGQRANDICYKHLAKVAEDIIAFDTGEGYGLMDDNGKVIVESSSKEKPWKRVAEFSKFGYAIVTLEKYEEYAVIDKQGNYLISSVKCWRLAPLSADRLFIYDKHKVGIIDINGKEIVPPVYISIIPDDDFYIVKTKKYGLLDHNGNVILEPIYDEIIETQDKYVVRDFSKIEIPKNKEVKKQ